MPSLTLLCLVFLVAMVYASVGHGGASGYLATLSFLGCDPMQMSASALILNVCVAGLACFVFWRAGHFSWRLTWPFLVTSIPAAAFGGWLPVARHTYQGFFAAVLLAAAVRLWLKPPLSNAVRRGPHLLAAVPVGAGIGLVSGIVGVGGGIFLSPIMVLRRWADAKQAAATAAAFIVLNSLAGLAGRLAAGRCEVNALLPLVVSAFAGGFVGSHVGANHLPHLRLCHILGLVLVMAAGTLAFRHG